MAIPNFDPATGGKLAVSRYDFQSHIDGYSNGHYATAISLNPPITINSINTTNVQDAMELFATLVNPPDIIDASTTNKGIIQISGDIRGTATNILVSGIQGKPITNTAPTNNQTLVFDGYTNSWTPSSINSSFVAGGDLEGTTNLQNVISLTGRLDKVSIIANNLLWANNSTAPKIGQDSGPGTGKNLRIVAQSSTTNGARGGHLDLFGGEPGTGGLQGGINLGLSNGASKFIQIKEVGAGRRVLALLHDSDVTSADMPNDSGDRVIYIRDTSTPPVTGTPTNGTEVYSFGGKLFVKQSDGNNFAVGSIPNPSVWGTSNEQVYSSRNTITTTTAIAQDVFTFIIPNFTSVKVDVIAVGKKPASIESAQYNLSIGYSKHNSTPTTLGTLTSADPRGSSGTLTWTAPTISLSGSQIKVKSGFSNTETVTWIIVTQLTIVTTSS
jgi:hypothetical protein